MESTDKVKRIGDKEIEYLILKYIAEHEGAKESEICGAIPARPFRVAGYLKDFVSGDLLELRQDDSTYTVRRYTLTPLGRFLLSVKVLDCGMVHGSFKVSEMEDIDLGGRDLTEETEMLVGLAEAESGRRKAQKRGRRKTE